MYGCESQFILFNAERRRNARLVESRRRSREAIDLGSLISNSLSPPLPPPPPYVSPATDNLYRDRTELVAYARKVTTRSVKRNHLPRQDNFGSHDAPVAN